MNFDEWWERQGSKKKVKGKRKDIAYDAYKEGRQAALTEAAKVARDKINKCEGGHQSNCVMCGEIEEIAKEIESIQTET